LPLPPLPPFRLESIGLPPHLLTAIHTPGHSAGSLSFLARQQLVNPDTAGRGTAGGSAARPGDTEGSTGEATVGGAGDTAGGEGGVLFSGDHFAFNGRLGRLDGIGRFGDDVQMQVCMNMEEAAGRRRGRGCGGLEVGWEGSGWGGRTSKSSTRMLCGYMRARSRGGLGGRGGGKFSLGITEYAGAEGNERGSGREVTGECAYACARSA
jgi:hypothetical protein